MTFMNYKKILLIVIVVIIFVAGGFAAYYYRDSLLGNVQKQEKDTQEQTINLEDKTITDKEKPFNITIAYPYVEGLNDFNKKSEEIVQNELSQFKEISLENDRAVKEIDPEAYAAYPREYYLNIGYDKGLINSEVISTVFDISNFTGGAHGAEYFISLNYDVQNKKEIKLADLFLDQPDYLQKISDYCTEDLKQQIRERADDYMAPWFEEGAGPNEENFSIFLINKDSITFYFPQYQVAAYALGDFRVTMPR